jgi:gliding motility-associated-like protein
MKKIVTCWVVLMGFLQTANADHITGGEMSYTLVSVSGNTYHYRVYMRLFMDCYSGRQLPNPAIFGVFDKATGTRMQDISVPMSNQQNLTLTNAGPCITNPPRVCYEIGSYSFDIVAPAAIDGYVVVLQVVYRVNGIANLAQGYGNVGATYTADIPGTRTRADGPNNNSARFNGSDLVVICANNSFTYNFGAEDPDGDQLRYSFCNAYTGGSSGGIGTNTSPAPPPYNPVPYGGDFGPNAPLGGAVQIDPNTGVITGIAPGEGIYVVTVCVDEIRNGVVIGTQRKDLQISITDCAIAAASIQPEYMLCKSSRTINLVNNSTSPLITSYNWELLNNAGTSIFNSTQPQPSFTFADTGTYLIKLVINRNQQCSDSATAIARVYPGFRPDFTIRGICFTKPTQFFDATTTVFGAVDSWRWDLGEPSAVNDVSVISNPVYTYPTMGMKSVRLIATNTNGCRDTAIKTINVLDKPPLSVRFRDTLICTPDMVQLEAIGSGIFSWGPAVNITNANTPTPTVNPTTTTTYVVRLDDNGCLNSDSVRVRVVSQVTLNAMPDTTICQTDTIRMRVASDGLQYLWSTAGQAQILNPTAASAQVITFSTTTYDVTARIGSCTASDRVVVTAIPYPVVSAGPDTLICHQTLAQLQGSTDGNFYRWQPASTLNDITILNPMCNPTLTSSYVLYATDTRGCPKPSYDTVTVVVLPDIIPNAGRDTSVVVGQPLRLNATGGIRYAWSPAGGLSDPAGPDPIITYLESTPGIQYKVLVYNEAGCADSAFVKVKVFETMPTIFVPNAFTPNGDGRNDLLRPIAAGMQRIEFFQVFNRWGQMVFSTNINEHGWDGTIAGKHQGPGAYVWVVKAVDYTGVRYTQRGTVLLIR